MKAQLKFSVPDWCMAGKYKDVLRYYQRLKTFGIEAMEMVPPKRWALACQAGLKRLNLSGPGMVYGLNRMEHHAALLPQIRELIKVAGRSGIPYVIMVQRQPGRPVGYGRDKELCPSHPPITG